jgi:TonB-like protein
MSRFSTVLAVAALTGVGAAAGSRPAWPQTLVHASLGKTEAKAGKAPKISACPARFDDSLTTDGVVPMGTVPGVTPPKAVWTQEAEFTSKARKEIHKRAMFPYKSTSMIALVVDPKGLPRDLCVQKSAEFDLDKAAADSVWQYRFQPATKDGKPVAKRLAVEVKFAMN